MRGMVETKEADLVTIEEIADMMDDAINLMDSAVETAKLEEEVVTHSSDAGEAALNASHLLSGGDAELTSPGDPTNNSMVAMYTPEQVTLTARVAVRAAAAIAHLAMGGEVATVSDAASFFSDVGQTTPTAVCGWLGRRG